MNPKGKVALVTGGAQRVGKAITLALAQAGADVVVNYHSSARAAVETVAAVEELGQSAIALQADVSDEEQVQGLFEAAYDRFGKVDILVNSASLWRRSPFPTDDVSDWNRVSHILIDGSFYCSNAAVPGMLERGEGVIVNILDLAAIQPFYGMAAHSVGKAGMLALTKQLALELAPSIRVNGVAPGAVLPPDDLDESRIQEIADRNLLKRWGTPGDVAEAVLYLIKARFVTGEVLVVDGGERLGHLKYEQ